MAPTQRARTRSARRRRIARRGWFTLTVLFLLVIGGGTALAARLSGGYLMLAAKVAGVAAGWMHQTTTYKPNSTGTLTPVAPQEPFSVLVLGTEQAPAYAGPQLTDSMMVMSFDPKSKTASIMSLPRDLYLDIPHFGYNRINTAYENGGVGLAELTVEKYFGIPIEYYAIVNYQSFVNLVNAVGGVDVVVPQNINDSCYPNPLENQCTVFQLSAGPHHLDGATALKFIRERHSMAEGDLTREADQQQVLLSLKDALLQPSNIPHLGTIINDVFNAVDTNVPYSNVPTLAAQVLHLPKSSIHATVLDYSTNAVANATIGGADVLKPNWQVIHQMVSQDFAPLLAPMSQYTVQVLNGTPSAEPLATEFSQQVLQPMGVQTLTAAPADRTDYKDNQVILNTAVYKPGRGQPIPTEAYILGQMLGAQVQQEAVPSSQAQIVVILGSAFPPMQ